MRRRLVVTAVALGMYSTFSFAETEPHVSSMYITPMVTAVRTDSARSVDDAPAFTLAAGFEPFRHWNVELNLFRGTFERADGDHLQMNAAGINVLRVFRRNARVEPYLLMGVGSLHKEQDIGADANNVYADAGGGFFVRLRGGDTVRNSLSLRVDLRARHDGADEGERLDWLLGMGLQYAFGGPVRDTAPAAVPPPTPVPAQPLDSDGDGVFDDEDRCPATRPGAVVGADGCDLDSDRDRVRIPADECPATPEGTRVNAHGCELRDEISLPRVAFAYNSDELLPESFAALDDAVETLEMNPDLRIEIAGHTDYVGSDAFNLDLSARRAESVRRYLAAHGVTNELTTRGYGEGLPVADNATEEGRARNRRVLLRILPQ